MIHTIIRWTSLIAVAVGATFEHVGVMTQREETASALFDMGRYYGRIMYLLDSVQDYHGGMSAGRFNPLTSIWSSGDSAVQIRGYFQDAVYGLRTQLASLNIPRPSLANAMLVRQLRCNGNRILRASLVGGGSIAYQTNVGSILTWARVT